MPAKLYVLRSGPAGRAVQMCIRQLGLDVEIQEVSIADKEHLTPQYLKMNPQHTVPTFVDKDGFVVWDSHAIMAYLVGKYAKNDDLYPKDLKKRAVIDQRLHFDSNVLFPRGLSISRSIIRHGAKGPNEEQAALMLEAYEFVEKFLEGNTWVAGNMFTIADLSFAGSMSSWCKILPLDPSKHAKIITWLKKMEILPCYEANIPGLKYFEYTITSSLEKNMKQ